MRDGKRRAGKGMLLDRFANQEEGGLETRGLVVERRTQGRELL